MNTLYAETDQALNAIRKNTNAGGMVVQMVHGNPKYRSGYRKDENYPNFKLDCRRFWLSVVSGVSVRSGHRLRKIRVWSSRPMRPSYVLEISKVGMNTWCETEESAG